jgi:hypothetical protein
MNVSVPEQEVLAAVELLTFIADLCADRPEELNVALCRFTATYFPATDLRAEVKEMADGLARVLGFSDASLEPAS